MESGEHIELEVAPDDAGRRLDEWFAERLGDAGSRSQVQKWIEGGLLLGGGRRLRSSTRVKAGERYGVVVPAPVLPDLTPVDLNLRLLYEDEELAVIVKPPGIAVHPGPGDGGLTLLNGLLHLWKDLPEHSDPIRPGIVHRLDKLTEGLLVVAKTERALRALSARFKERSVLKEYWAWLLASPPRDRDVVSLPLERHPVQRLKMRIAKPGTGREAISIYRIERVIPSQKGRRFTLTRIRIRTGRTHQIRVHMAHLGAPVVGDPLYSRSASHFSSCGMLLLARRLRFHHPLEGRELEFELEFPERFVDFEQRCHLL